MMAKNSLLKKFYILKIHPPFNGIRNHWAPLLAQHSQDFLEDYQVKIDRFFNLFMLGTKHALQAINTVEKRIN